jgi:hypothetical protein
MSVPKDRRPAPVNAAFRQIHLDFHTSRDCSDVGRDFDASAFAGELERAHVSSMNVFARCHHGFCYYPTSVGTTHPNLQRDLLGQQIEALHSIGARAPIYVTLMWDDLAAEREPSWVIMRRDGTPAIRSPLSGESQVAGGWSWSTLDLSSGYGDFVMAQVEELCRLYQPDGFWFDICFTMPNYSPWGQAQMRTAGVDMSDEQQVVDFTHRRLLAFMDRLSSLVRARVPEASIAFNHATDAAMSEKLSFQTQLDIESLPTATHQWGYLHYPIAARQARVHGLPFVGMTGRFHKSWADFGGLKTHDQLLYECGTILSAGGRVAVGDQLQPRGVLDPAVYRLVGGVFGRVAALEPWLADTTSVTDLAILCVGERKDRGSGVYVSVRPPDLEGAAQVFLELGVQFDIVDADPEVLARYGTVVVPEGTPLKAPVREMLEAHLARGGRLILSGTAGLDGPSVAIAGLPYRYLGPAPTVPSYIRLDAGLIGEGELADDYDYACYVPAHRVQPLDGADGLGELRSALFNRTWQHFTSHAQAPVGESLGAPIVVQSEHVLYFAAPLFTGYRDHDYWVYREIVRSALDRFLPSRQVRSSAAGWVEVGLLRQAPVTDGPQRLVVHLTSYQSRRTMQGVPHVDQAWPVTGVKLALRTGDRPPSTVYLVPERQALAFHVDGDTTVVEVPPFRTHAVVVLE